MLHFQNYYISQHLLTNSTTRHFQTSFNLLSQTLQIHTHYHENNTQIIFAWTICHFMKCQHLHVQINVSEHLRLSQYQLVNSIAQRLFLPSNSVRKLFNLSISCAHTCTLAQHVCTWTTRLNPCVVQQLQTVSKLTGNMAPIVGGLSLYTKID